MKRTILAVLMVVITLAMTGCGGGGSSPPPTFVAQITSEPSLDGDIFRDFLTQTAFPITQGMTLSTPAVQSVLAGIDPTPVTGGEYRAFLNFRLDATNGVPLNAIISSAFLDLFITSNVSGPIPIDIDLVALQSLTSRLTPPDFNSTFRSTVRTTLNNLRANVQQQVSIDVTPLMVEAQRLGLLDFQIRILCGSGIIEINDTTINAADRILFAPLLDVTYF